MGRSSCVGVVGTGYGDRNWPRAQHSVVPVPTTGLSAPHHRARSQARSDFSVSANDDGRRRCSEPQLAPNQQQRCQPAPVIVSFPCECKLHTARPALPGARHRRKSFLLYPRPASARAAGSLARFCRGCCVQRAREERSGARVPDLLPAIRGSRWQERVRSSATLSALTSLGDLPSTFIDTASDACVYSLLARWDQSVSQTVPHRGHHRRFSRSDRQTDLGEPSPASGSRAPPATARTRPRTTTTSPSPPAPTARDTTAQQPDSVLPVGRSCSCPTFPFISSRHVQGAGQDLPDALRVPRHLLRLRARVAPGRVSFPPVPAVCVH